MVHGDTQQHLSKRLRRASPAIYQTTGNRRWPWQYKAARDITGTKLKHHNTDSNRSTGGNKYYKSKIGRKEGRCSPENIAEGSTEDWGDTRINSTALSAK